MDEGQTILVHGASSLNRYSQEAQRTAESAGAYIAVLHELPTVEAGPSVGSRYRKKPALVAVTGRSACQAVGHQRVASVALAVEGKDRGVLAGQTNRRRKTGDAVGHGLAAGKTLAGVGTEVKLLTDAGKAEEGGVAGQATGNVVLANQTLCFIGRDKESEVIAFGAEHAGEAGVAALNVVCAEETGDVVGAQEVGVRASGAAVEEGAVDAVGHVGGAEGTGAAVGHQNGSGLALGANRLIQTLDAVADGLVAVEAPSPLQVADSGLAGQTD